MLKEYSTINTFTRRPVPAQLITYLVFIVEALTFFICMYVNFRNTAKQVTILVLYLLSVTVQAYLTLSISCSDPSDSIMIEYRNNASGRRDLNVDSCLYCEICMSYVHENSRHCKVCQRCVQNFDHHCMWINNCVGSKNYRSFLAMTAMTLVNLIVYIIGMILLWTEQQWRNYLGSMVTIWVFSFFIIVILILMLNLIGLHIYLIYKGITTYQFIILQRQEQNKKKDKEMQTMQVINIQEIRQITMVPVTNKNFSKRNEQEIHDERPPPLINHSEFKSQNNIKNHQNSVDMIFGNNLNQNYDENQNKTQKSSYIPKKQEDRRDPISIDKNQNKQEQERGSLSSKKQKQDNVSQFFTRNKSLKFFIGDEIGARPKSPKVQFENIKQKLYKSARVENSESKKIDLNYKQGKNINQNRSSRQLKMEKITTQEVYKIPQN